MPKVRHGCAVAFVSKAAEPNFQYRPYMEDKYCIIDPFMEGEFTNETWGFFAVYDGHGGSAAAEHCEAELHKVLAQELRSVMKMAPRRPSSPLRDEAVAEAMTRTFQKADEQLKTVGAWRYGCTATVCLVRRMVQSISNSAIRKLGLENKRGSNHCFLNVVIQALWNLQAFRTRLLAEPHGHANRSTCHMCCYCELKSLFQEYNVSDAATLPPDGLRRALSSVYNAQRFKVGEMEDASETLEAILGILHACHVEDTSQASQPLNLRHVEKASTFGCHPLCFAHDVFGIEYVDVPHCKYCGATGEPSICSSYLYSTYTNELMMVASRGVDGSSEITTDPIGAFQDLLARATHRLSAPPVPLQDLLRDLSGQSQGPCVDCKSSKTTTERWLTRRPRIFTISLVWPNSTPLADEIWLILNMLRPQLKLEEIFKVSPPCDDMSYCFHGMICYKHSQHYVAFFWCAARKRWTFFDDRIVEEKDDWVSVANFLLAEGYVPTLIFYERMDGTNADSLAELDRQVANVGDSRAVCIDGSGGTQRLSMDHRPSDPAEARRVREEGGFVTMGRVAGELAISRALGDLLLKNQGLSCKPSVRAHDAKRDLALCVASDGLWDFVEEKDVGKVVTECSRNGLEHVANRLVQESQRSGSMDNITCLAVFL
eukprot:symbB.v1.2.015433.t2/scaffold1121.1/size137196/1